ncbi:MAG: hypothetical protein C4521_03495 [Actinobacteria bacterium]|nr:MAG: hypothetical protein C4521_03495 [Actinomycetota bacterium]
MVAPEDTSRRKERVGKDTPKGDLLRRTIIAVTLIALAALALGAVGSCGGQGQGSGGGPSWLMNDLAQGQEQATAQKKAIVLYFGASW